MLLLLPLMLMPAASAAAAATAAATAAASAAAPAAAPAASAACYALLLATCCLLPATCYLQCSHVWAAGSSSSA
jgi:hypothetical protein